ncbi:MAG: cobalt-zinc-cadmium efflux system outer membrane protein [Verrucomicrobiales bacterium]|jgi:cobalt-zinc-cadmium efflux system outer membrane protein
MRVLLYILTLGLAGCTTPTKVTQQSSSVLAMVAPHSKSVSYAVGSSADLDDLVQHALVHHPSITAAEAKVRRLLARVPQAASLPDPKFKIASGAMAETAAGRVDWMAGVEQALPFPGKLREMARAAGKEAEAATAQLEAVRLSVAAQVEQAYWNLYLANRTVSITTQNSTVLESIRSSVDARVAANQANQGDQLRLSTEAGKLEQVLIQARLGEASARSRLNALLNRPNGSELPTPKFRQRIQKKDLQALLAVAESQHPEVKAASAELVAYQHRLNRAELERYPDFMLGVQHAAVSDSGLAPSANGRDQVFASIGVSIPLWQSPRRAKIDEARAGIEESTAKIGSARAGLRHEVEDAWLRSQSAEELITLFAKQILPESQQAFDGVLTGYGAGEESFVDALDAWRQLLAFQLQQAGNQAQLGQALAALRKATASHL